MRILITNNTLAERAGTELYVRDLALALLGRGHHPIAYSQILGAIADELRAATVPVVDDLHKIAEPPHIIHGHHHLETMTAIHHFPGTPAVFFCHGWLPWQEAPPRHPRITRYVAVDDLCRQRLVHEAGIDASEVDVIYNFVDLDRFLPRDPLPATPQRALYFSNYAEPGTAVREIERACAEAGLDFEVVGRAFGGPCDSPEEILPDFDLVFAKGRAALEAMAVGCAVVVCDPAGAGPMVHSENFGDLRRLNFGLRAMSSPLTRETLAGQIAGYDAKDAAAVSARVRSEAGLSPVVDRLVSLYESAAGFEPAGPEPEGRAAADYLRTLAPAVKENDSMHRRLLLANGEAERCRDRVEALRRDLEDRVRELDQLRHSSTRLEHSRESADRRVAELEAEIEEQRAKMSALGGELSVAYGTLTWRFREFVLASPLGRLVQRFLSRIRGRA
jgi:hypothetical protein